MSKLHLQGALRLMLSLADLKHKQILFIQTERGCENKIKFWNENIRFVKDGKNINQVSCHTVLAVFVIGDISLTSKIIEKCKEYGISIFLLKQNFNCYASILSEAEGNYLLREKQYSYKKDIEFSKNLIRNKLYNQSVLLKQPSWPLLFTQTLEKAKTNKELLGIEGASSKDYFQKYFLEIGWNGRMPRTKKDISNLLLDIGYTYLFNYIDSLLRLYGFDTYKGIYHKLFFQRRSLSCDTMEPFRVIIDHALLKAYHLGQIRNTDFYQYQGRCVLRYDKSINYSRIFAEAILGRKEEIYSYVKNFYRYMAGASKTMPYYKMKAK